MNLTVLFSAFVALILQSGVIKLVDSLQSFRFLCKKITSREKLSILHSSVSPGSAPPSKPKAFIIPTSSSQYGEAEKIIITNMNQIQSGAQSKIGIIGSSELDENQQQMVELLSYALVLSGNHVFTSAGGVSSTNVAVIRGALRACNPDLLSVILPQSLYRQPPDIQMLLSRVTNIIEQPQYDDLELKEAANLCNYKLLSCVDKVLVFVYHSTNTILGPLEDFEGSMSVIRFYLD